MIIANKDKVRLEGNAVTLINQIELIMTAYKNGLIESGETNESIRVILVEAMDNALKRNDYYRYTAANESEEAEENNLMLLLKEESLNEFPERIYTDLIEKHLIKENIKRIKK